MTIFDYFKKVHEYLFTIRNVKDNGKNLFVFDMKFPAKWDAVKYLTPEEKKKIQIQKPADESILYISFFTSFSEKAVNDMYDKIVQVIGKCIEEEKKVELLNLKIKELKEKFNDMSLEDLEQLVFKTKDNEKQQSVVTDS